MYLCGQKVLIQLCARKFIETKNEDYAQRMNMPKKVTWISTLSDTQKSKEASKELSKARHRY